MYIFDNYSFAKNFRRYSIKQFERRMSIHEIEQKAREKTLRNKKTFRRYQDIVSM